NHDAINAILADTRDVARLLADAMASAEQEPAKTDGRPTPVPAPLPNVIPAGQDHDMGTGRPADSAAPALHARYTAFYGELVVRSSWDRADAEALARRHGHMLAGAIEAINEWSLDRHGVPLVDESETSLVLDTSLR